ncbi:NUDIX hydrolase [Alkaliphilus oremlandii]|uniref:NUDIX hydrolase n=1 Tax=Alkaliphilus oremlandii (strain OhILAs) TaxID=350688 RepID=A8MKN7_ALKOO|nr:NUDIX hydrolase [Alkaliphilus oremlandii]ABW20369.1 NUDIX hydrolase [Alkaliphilus oremlandii OhILAs]
MQGYNIIMVYNKDLDRLLMCKRRKDPYMGLYNLVGGKIDPGEEGFAAAYRELYEETGISKEDIQLKHLMDFRYYYQQCYVEVYVGKLNKEVMLVEEVHALFWSDLDHDFFDMSIYAGEGNIGHMIEQVNMYRNQIFL